jgi:hypothetical protein
MCNTIVGDGAASRCGSGSDQKMQLLAAPAPQHWNLKLKIITGARGFLSKFKSNSLKVTSKNISIGK